MCPFFKCNKAKPLEQLEQPSFGPHPTPVPIGDSGFMLLGALLGVAVLKWIRR